MFDCWWSFITFPPNLTLLILHKTKVLWYISPSKYAFLITKLSNHFLGSHKHCNNKYNCCKAHYLCCVSYPCHNVYHPLPTQFDHEDVVKYVVHTQGTHVVPCKVLVERESCRLLLRKNSVYLIFYCQIFYIAPFQTILINIFFNLSGKTLLRTSKNFGMILCLILLSFVLFFFICECDHALHCLVLDVHITNSYNTLYGV